MIKIIGDNPEAQKLFFSMEILNMQVSCDLYRFISYLYDRYEFITDLGPQYSKLLWNLYEGTNNVSIKYSGLIH